MSQAETQDPRCLTARLDEDFHKQVRVEAARREISMSELMRVALRNELGDD